MTEFKELQDLLTAPLNTDNPVALANQAVQAEAWSARISDAYRSAEEILAERKGQTFNPSLSSEDKRKIDLEYRVRVEQTQVDKLKDLADIIKRRISLAQTLLNSHRTELESGIRL